MVQVGGDEDQDLDASIEEDDFDLPWDQPLSLSSF